MRLMGLEAIYPKPRTVAERRRDTGFTRICCGMWRSCGRTRCGPATSPTCRCRTGWMYLTVVMDWYSRYVLSWRLSNTLGRAVSAWRRWRKRCASGTPEIFNTDQGVQYTAAAFTGRLEAAGVAISMDGRGRWMDNVFVERLWRTVKYEYVYLHDYATPWETEEGLAAYFRFYREDRPHSRLGNQTPGEVYRAGRASKSHPRVRVEAPGRSRKRKC